MTKKRVALKYCGGCDPAFDRVEYFNRIRSAARESIEWVTLADSNFSTVLVISGCETACPEPNLDPLEAHCIVSVKDDKTDPREIVATLLQ
jgi:hypothetical protein